MCTVQDFIHETLSNYSCRHEDEHLHTVSVTDQTLGLERSKPCHVSAASVSAFLVSSAEGGDTEGMLESQRVARVSTP